MPGPPISLWGEKKMASLYEQSIVFAVHVDCHIGRGGGEVPERQSPVVVEKTSNHVRVRDDAGHVRGCREAPDLEGPVGVAVSSSRRWARSMCPSASSRDADNVGD